VSVLARVRLTAVRVELIDEPEHAASRRHGAPQATRYRLAGGLVAVHAADHQNAPCGGGIADDSSENLTTPDRTAYDHDPDVANLGPYGSAGR
jgi:hypothetical protein